MAGGKWIETQAAGHPADLFEPDRPRDDGLLVIYLHGVHLGRLVDKPAYTELFEQHGLRVVAPMTQRSWWTDRICAEFDPQVSAERHLLDGVLPWIRDRYGAEPPAIGLLGTSMGGQGALRLAFKYPDTFPAVAAVSPAIDYQHRFDEGDETLPLMYPDPEAARQDTATLHVHPLNYPRNIWFSCDPADARWYDSADRLRMKLSSLGIPHESDLETTAGGHGWDYYNHMAPAAVGFLVAALERESRRV